MTWLRHWWPALAWAAIISLFSTGLFSGENTSRFILPILARLFPRASVEALAFVHFLIRKSGHFVEYFLFSLLVLRGIRAGRREWRWTWAAAALAAAACYAGLDEFHQAFVPTRTASIYDVLLDSFGAAVAQLFAALRARLASKSFT
jgi:VanZ family protein